MAIKTSEEIKKIGGNIITSGYVYDETTPSDKTLVYEINKNKKIIEFHPYKSKYYFFDKITLDGFTALPEILKKNGYSKNRIIEYINRLFKDKRIKSVNITRTGNSQIVKRGRNKHLHLSYKRLLSLSNDLGSMDFYHKRKRSLMVYKQFSKDFPTVLKAKSMPDAQNQIKEALQTLAIQNVDSYEKDDINRMTDVLASLMKTAARSQITKSQLFKNTKLKIDTVTLNEVIDEFEDKLKKKPSEATWGTFLQGNLFLIDSKYIHSIPQLNLVLGGARKVDFGLVDIQGYLDLFEIKKPETKLLSSHKDARGNYIWDRQAIESIVQAEKYLLHAESKRDILKNDIKRERQVALDVIRPRAFVIMGNSDQLDNDAKKEDFRMLKNQFKNIEIILYDELLNRIKNQKKSIEKGNEDEKN